MKKAWQPNHLSPAKAALMAISLILAFLTSSGLALAQINESSDSRISLASPANELKPRKWSGEWWLGVGAANFTEAKDESTSGMVKLGVKFRYEMAEWVRISLEPELRSYSSRTQARYEGEVNQSGFRLKEGYVGFGLEETFDVKVGALSQKVLRSELLISGRRAFPGLRETLTLGPKSLQLRASAQQVVPTSYSLNSERVDKEQTPTLLTETLDFKITPAKTFEAEVHATHFRFNHLPAVVAFESMTLGNTVDGDEPATSTFRYNFEGFLLGSRFCVCLGGPISFTFGGQWLQNAEAPTKSNRGQLLFLQSNIKPNSSIELVPKFTTYFNESDTSPGTYNRWELGNNNRKGIAAELEILFPKQGFKVEMYVVQAKVINQDPFQGDKQSFYISVETDHVPF